MIDFEKAPSFQGVCDTEGIIVAGEVGMDYYDMRIAIDSHGTPQLGIPKELIISDDPEQVTLTTRVEELLLGKEVTIKDSTSGEYKLAPSNVISFIFKIQDNKITVFPPLDKEEEAQLIELPRVLLKTGTISQESYDGANAWR